MPAGRNTIGANLVHEDVPMRRIHAGPGHLQPRRFLPDFGSHPPRHWCGGDPVLTHLLNAYTLLVPGNEGYFIRALKAAMPSIADPGQRWAIAQFMRQEGQHGAAHLRCLRLLESQGYRIAGFRRAVDGFLYRVLEPLTPLGLRLSMVACVEHVNAYLGHEYLAQRWLESADPELRALFEWHFAEEIEHKHVAYDALAAAAPGYGLRLLGAVVVVPMFYALCGLGAAWLLWQDGLLTKAATGRAVWRHLIARDRMLARTRRHLRAYLRPGFHPWQLDDGDLAVEAIARYSSPRGSWLSPLPEA